MAATIEGLSLAMPRAIRGGVASVERHPVFATIAPTFFRRSPNDIPATVYPNASPFTAARFSRSTSFSIG